MSHTRRSSMSTSCSLIPQHRSEEEPEPERAIARDCQIVESPRTTKRAKFSAGLSPASLAVLERTQELELKLVKLEKVVAEGTARSGPSRPLGISSASVALQRRNDELEEQLARLENLRMKEYRVSGEDLMSTTWSEGSVRCIGSEQQLLMDKRRDERIRNLELRKMLRQAQELDLAFLLDATGSMEITPCHGEEFHGGVRAGVEDDYPNGDSKGRDISKLLAALRHDCQILNYLFCHITDSTKKMLKVFRERAPQGGWIQEEKLDKISNLLEVVVSASCTSIAVSTRVIGEGPAVPRYVPVAWKNEIPQWNNIKRQKGEQFSYRLPATLEDLFKIVEKNRSLVLKQKLALTVQIALRPFSDEGKVRWPYSAQVHEDACIPPITRKMVVKRFKVLVGEDVSKVHSMEAYCEQMEVQTVAAFMAEHFNQELKKLSGLTDYKTVQFMAVSVLQVGDSTYNMEKWLEGKWIRYSNNVNYVNTKEYAATLHAFSHWTYERSNGLLMVTDLQGVQVEGSDGKKVFMLCDPAVHCKHVYRYARTKTNWSTAGMDSFFETHQCNNICRSLNLKPKSSSFTCEGTVINYKV